MKLELFIKSGTLQGRKFELEQGTMMLGRGLDCDLRFDATGDPGVSTHHAILQLESDGFYIIDQKSTNGTIVNGQVIQRTKLAPGNIIQLGHQGPHILVQIEAPVVIPPTIVSGFNNIAPTRVSPSGPVSAPNNMSNANMSGPGQPNPQFGGQNIGAANSAGNAYSGQNMGGNTGGQNAMGPNMGGSGLGASNMGRPNLGGPSSLRGAIPPDMPGGVPISGGMPAMAGGFAGGGATATLRQTFSNIGIYDPEKEKSSNGRSILGIGAAIAVGLVMVFIVMILMVLSVGPVGAIVGTILAFTPAPFYLMLFLWLDRYDPEPAWALLLAFCWGGLFAVIVSFIVNTIFSGLAMTIVGGPTGDVLGAVISAPIIEEGTKGLGVVLFMVFLRSEFDDILDGIVYAGVIALGFATVENVLYYGNQVASGGINIGLIFILFLRGVLAPFSHSLFTSMTGIGCGISRESHNKVLRIVMPMVGYAVAVFLHALWNGIASIVGSLIGYLFFYIIIWVPLFLIMLIVMIYMSRREAKLIKEMLAVEVARGLINKEQLELIGSSMARMKWLGSSLMSGNFQKYKVQRQYLRAVTKLAFCYWHVARASAANNQTRSLPQIPKFQAEVTQLKAQL